MLDNKNLTFCFLIFFFCFVLYYICINNCITVSWLYSFLIPFSFMLSVFLHFQSKCLFPWRCADEMVLFALTLSETSTLKRSIVLLYSAHNSVHMPRLVRAKSDQQSQLWLEIEFILTVMLACHQLQ